MQVHFENKSFALFPLYRRIITSNKTSFRFTNLSQSIDILNFIPYILKCSICNRLLLNILQVISQKYGLNL